MRNFVFPFVGLLLLAMATAANTTSRLLLSLSIFERLGQSRILG